MYIQSLEALYFSIWISNHNIYKGKSFPLICKELL